MKKALCLGVQILSNAIDNGKKLEDYCRYMKSILFRGLFI